MLSLFNSTGLICTFTLIRDDYELHPIPYTIPPSQGGCYLSLVAKDYQPRSVATR